MVGSSSIGRTDAQTPLIGREFELAAIAEAVEHVEGGTGHSIVVTGALGMGKSRLLDEALKSSKGRSFNIVHGSGSLIDSDLAYAPILHGIGRALGALKPFERAKLVRGLDSIGLILEGLDLPEPAPLGDPALERTRLFESIVRLIDRLATHHPLFMAFDDVQWLDEASLDFLAYLAQDLSSLKVLLFLSIDPHESSLWAERFMSHLRGATTCTELRPAALDTTQVGALAEQILGSPVRLVDAEALATTTGGNPLLTITYIDEMVRDGGLKLVQGRWVGPINLSETVPPAAKDIYLARILRLDGRARTILETIAIDGGETLHRHLVRLSQLDESDLTPVISHLESLGLILTEDRGHGVIHRCAQPAISSVAYNGVPLARRQTTHARFIEILEEDVVGPEALVWHYRQVGGEADQKRRLTVLIDAGRWALDRYANDDAVQLLGAALDVSRSTDRPDQIPILLEVLGEALQRTGEEHAAIETWREATALSRETGARARLARRMAASESNLGHFSRARHHIETGMAHLTDENSPEFVELRALDILNSFRASDIGRAAAGIDLFRDLANDRPAERTVMNLAILTTGLALERASYEEAGRQAQTAYNTARSLDDPVSQQQALAFLALDDLSLGDLDALDHHLEVNMELTKGIGIRLRTYRILLYQLAGDIYAGRWDHAADVAIEATLLAQRIEELRNRVVLVSMPALLDIFKGDYEQADKHLDKARESLTSLGIVEPRLPAVIEILDSWIAVEAGHPAKALATLEGRNGEFLQGLIPPWGRMLLGEAQAMTGDEKWTGTAAHLAEMGPPGSLPWLWSLRIKGIAETDPQTAIEVWDQAATGFDDLHMPFEAARARLHAMERDESGEPDRVNRLKEDHRLFTRLGASRYRDRTHQLLRSFGATTATAESHGPSALSPRQTEVARLVAEGFTNGEIADRLFISRRTVTTHLENIYRQLGISSRTTLTRYVLEKME